VAHTETECRPFGSAPPGGSNLRTPQAGFRRVVFPTISPLPTGSDLRQPGSYACTSARPLPALVVAPFELDPPHGRWSACQGRHAIDSPVPRAKSVA
jgi:hypothetical protein